jgi:hypothetical protein
MAPEPAPVPLASSGLSPPPSWQGNSWACALLKFSISPNGQAPPTINTILQSRQAADPWTSSEEAQAVARRSIKRASPQSDAHLLPNPHAIHQPAIMILDDEVETRLRTIRPDSTLLELDPKEEAFFKEKTGIQDTEELRKHIIGVQEEAYEVRGRLRVDWVH